MKKERNTTIEWLRLALMFFIVLHHVGVHGFLNNPNLTSGQHTTALILSSFGKIAVALFVLISGYFQAQKTTLNKKSLLATWRVTLLYSITIFIIFILLGKVNLTIHTFIKYCFPVASGVYWFVTAYILLLLVAPYLNRFFLQLNKKEATSFLIGASVVAFGINYLSFFDLSLSNLVYFFIFYLTGSYLRRFYHPKKKINAKLIILTMVTILFYFLIIVIGEKTNHHIFSDVTKLISPFTIIIATLIFLIALRINIPITPFINGLARCAFAVYLIHDNPLVRSYIYPRIFHAMTMRFSSPITLIIVMVFDTILIFMISLAIEWVRRLIMNHLKKDEH